MRFLSTKDIKLSKYKTASSLICDATNLYDELSDIKHGRYEEMIGRCRYNVSIGDILGYKSQKLKLPAITFSGFFEGSHRADNLRQYSDHVIIDIDNLSVTETLELKSRIFEEKFVLASWISPSGNGLKVLVSTQAGPLYHRYVFGSLAIYFNERYNVNIDRSGSDICRLCFVSFDKDLLVKESCETYPFDITSVETKTENHSLKKKVFVNDHPLKFDRKYYNVRGDKDNRNDHLMMKKILTYLKKQNTSITSDYNSWYRVGFALANTFTYDHGLKYFISLCELDREKHNEQESKKMLEYCYQKTKGEIRFPTIISFAKNKGFIVGK